MVQQPAPPDPKPTLRRLPWQRVPTRWVLSRQDINGTWHDIWRPCTINAVQSDGSFEVVFDEAMYGHDCVGADNTERCTDPVLSALEVETCVPDHTRMHLREFVFLRPNRSRWLPGSILRHDLKDMLLRDDDWQSDIEFGNAKAVAFQSGNLHRDRAVRAWG